MPSINTAIFPVAGSGTRFLPFTKVLPKEMLPVGNKPLIQYCVEEAVESGIEHVVFVIKKGKELIGQHFCPNKHLEELLASNKKVPNALIELNNLNTKCDFSFVYQNYPNGLGDAIMHAKAYIKQCEYFAVFLPDDYIHCINRPCLSQMIDSFSQSPGNYVLAEKIQPQESEKYGVFIPDGEVNPQDKFFRYKGLVEKPRPADAPSEYAVAGRYILHRDVLSCIEKDRKGTAEIQITDAISKMANKIPSYGIRVDGTRYDCGTLDGYLKVFADQAW